MGVTLKLEIPEEVSKAMRFPPPELEARLRLELGVSLYAQEILSLGKAAELAEISRWEFNDVLARRGIPMHYSGRDLANDLAHVGRHQ